MNEYKIGIDLGGTNIVAGVVDKEFNIIARAECKTAILDRKVKYVTQWQKSLEKLLPEQI